MNDLTKGIPMKTHSGRKSAGIPLQTALSAVAANKFTTSHRRGPTVVVGPSLSCGDSTAWSNAEKLGVELGRQGDAPLVLFKTPPSGLPADDRCVIERHGLICDWFPEQPTDSERVPETVRGILSTAACTVIAPFPVADLTLAAEACRKAKRSVALISSDHLIEARRCRELMRCADTSIIRRADFESLFNVWNPEEDLAVNEIMGNVIVIGDDRVTFYDRAQATYQLPIPFVSLNRPGAPERFIAGWVQADLNDVENAESLASAIGAACGVDPEAGPAVAGDYELLDEMNVPTAAGPLNRWTYSLSTAAAAVGFITGWASHF